MRFKILCIAVGIAFGALGVAGAQKAGPYDRPNSPYAHQGSGPIDPKEAAYTLTRFIGLLDKGGGDCPAPDPKWKVDKLVDVAVKRGQEAKNDSTCRPDPWQPSPEDNALIRDLGLDRFCVYTTDKPRSDERNPFGGKLPRGLAAVAPDRMALSANGPNDLETAVFKPLAGTFKSETEGVAEAAGGLAFMPNAPSVRLAILDSQEDLDDVPRTPPAGSQHGYTLMHLAERLACPAGQCAAKIVSRRALGYTDFDPRQPLSQFEAGNNKGGTVGTVSDLGTAILLAILQWHRDGSPGHLILNLSLGWDGELFKDLEVSSVSKLPPDVLYVYNALRLAARSRVLVIAAAGNQKGGSPDSNWPLLPAAWEMRRPSWSPLLHRRRLIYSVGGVDWQGLPLPNSRNGGHPRRVAYGDHAVVDQGDGQPTAILTGSSVSTAVVSSIAAVIWHLRPELRPDQVMRLIDRSGEPQPMQADFYEWRTIWPLYLLFPPPQLSQVSLCSAVKHACPDGARCPFLAAAPRECRLPHQPALLNQFSPPPTTPSFIAETVSPLETCDPGRQFFGPNRGPATGTPHCPSAEYASVISRRWNFPQPDAVPCPGCSLDPPRAAAVAVETDAALAPPSIPATPRYTLHWQISDEWLPMLQSGLLQPGATLDVDCFDGSTSRSRATYRIPVNLRATQGVQAIPNISEGASLNGCTAQLNFVVLKDGVPMSVQNPVAVDPELPEPKP
jgi:hypothetical protein